MQYRPKWWLRSSAAPTHTATILYWFSGAYLLAVLALRYLAWRDPTSIFFRPHAAYARHYSDVRLHESAEYLANVTGVSRGIKAPRPHTLDRPELCVGMPSVARKGARYLRTAMASLLQGLTEEERSRLHLIVFLADLDPTRNPIYHEPQILGLADEVLTYQLDDEERDFIRGLDPQHKGVYDYRYLINACYKTGAQYTALIEDDVLAMDGWYPRTMHALDQVEAKADGDWLYLRLFYTEIYLGWNSENVHLRVLWSLFTIASTGFALIALRARSTWFRVHVNAWSMLVITCFCVPLTITLFFLGGKLTLMPLAHGVHKMNQYGCCSQGLVFNSHAVPAMLDWLGRTPSGHFFDMFVEVYADEHHLDRWAVQPPILQHMGMKSSGEDAEKDESAKKIWSFDYELYDPQEVRLHPNVDAAANLF